MIYAVRMGDFITNTIVASEDQKAELEAALNAELINTAECNLEIDDFWNGVAWTRNVNGEQVVVDTTPVYEPSTDERLDALEESNAEMTEALDMILSGVTE